MVLFSLLMCAGVSVLLGVPCWHNRPWQSSRVVLISCHSQVVITIHLSDAFRYVRTVQISSLLCAVILLQSNMWPIRRALLNKMRPSVLVDSCQRDWWLLQACFLFCAVCLATSPVINLLLWHQQTFAHLTPDFTHFP